MAAIQQPLSLPTLCSSLPAAGQSSSNLSEQASIHCLSVLSGSHSLPVLCRKKRKRRLVAHHSNTAACCCLPFPPLPSPHSSYYCKTALTEGHLSVTKVVTVHVLLPVWTELFNSKNTVFINDLQVHSKSNLNHLSCLISFLFLSLTHLCLKSKVFPFLASQHHLHTSLNIFSIFITILLRNDPTHKCNFSLTLDGLHNSFIFHSFQRKKYNIIYNTSLSNRVCLTLILL